MTVYSPRRLLSRWFSRDAHRSDADSAPVVAPSPTPVLPPKQANPSGRRAPSTQLSKRGSNVSDASEATGGHAPKSTQSLSASLNIFRMSSFLRGSTSVAPDNSTDRSIDRQRARMAARPSRGSSFGVCIQYCLS